MKIYSYTVFAAVLMVFFYLAGFDISGSFVFDKLGLIEHPENYESSTLFVLMASLFGAVAIGTAIIGAFTRTSPQYILKSTIIIPTLVLLILDFVWILNNTEGWVHWVIFIFLIPLMAGYAIALIEFWEARD